MFCSSLRKRPFWRTLGPFVASASPWKLQESSLETHDLALPSPLTSQESLLPILVLDPMNMVEIELPNTRARIEQFAATTKGQHSAIAFILKEEADDQIYPNGLQDFTHLQSLLIESNITSHALPVADVSALLATLEAYLACFKPAPKPVSTLCTLNTLIVHATASAPTKPLSVHNANVLSDIFCSLQDLEGATRTQEGRSKLYNYLDRRAAEDVIDFWADEWLT